VADSAATIAAHVRARRISAVESAAAALDAIASVDGEIHAFCTIDPNDALNQACAVDARVAKGDALPLAGVPVAIKDLILTKRLRTTFASPLYAQNIPDIDDVSVARLRAAGAIVIGKTNASEFGYGPVGRNKLFPTTRNPWNPALTTGGSSAGTGAAVAAGMVPFGLGSDGGGSIRIPAALCGVAGMKASWGRVPLFPGCRDESQPGASSWESLEHIGPLAACVADLALCLSVIAGPTPDDRHSVPLEPAAFAIAPPESLRGLRMAYSGTLGFAKVEREIAERCATAATAFARAVGATLFEADPPVGDTHEMFDALVALDTDRDGLRRMATAQGHVFDGALGRLMARDWTADEFTAAIMARKKVARSMARFMADFDLLLTPTTACAAYPLDAPEPKGWTPFTALANLTGQPAASVPAGLTADGRPVGLQIVGRHLADAQVLSACAAFEAILPWAALRPKIAAANRALGASPV
jgi:aspartyl-tRNA(Asn)/glutamyl-tRNA(Gln) amidotransferase subunit A